MTYNNFIEKIQKLHVILRSVVEKLQKIKTEISPELDEILQVFSDYPASSFLNLLIKDLERLNQDLFGMVLRYNLQVSIDAQHSAIKDAKEQLIKLKKIKRG